MRLVVDASVAVKWLIAEDDSHTARELAADDDELWSQDLKGIYFCHYIDVLILHNLPTYRSSEKKMFVDHALVPPSVFPDTDRCFL